MKCPFCGHVKDKVVDSRESGSGDAIRRRRECLSCSRRFTSYERVEEIPYFVVKKDGRREPFDREKIRAGLRMACKKRPVPMERIDDIVARIEGDLLGRYDREVRSKSIGDLIMRELKSLDHVAYVRFASVYREFKDVAEFMRELKPMLP